MSVALDLRDLRLALTEEIRRRGMDSLESRVLFSIAILGLHLFAVGKGDLFFCYRRDYG